MQSDALTIILPCRNTMQSDAFTLFSDAFSMQEISFALLALNPIKSPRSDNNIGITIIYLDDRGKMELLEICNLSWKLFKFSKDCEKSLCQT